MAPLAKYLGAGPGPPGSTPLPKSEGGHWAIDMGRVGSGRVRNVMGRIGSSQKKWTRGQLCWQLWC